ncbi:hypothetical protein [Okeania sp. SIO3B5]|nr:hypothetical protein [Okeania sp. SIO3B5]
MKNLDTRRKNKFFISDTEIILVLKALAIAIQLFSGTGILPISI